MADDPNSPAAQQSMMKTVYHRQQGAVTMYSVDANSAVQRFPDEWSHGPWIDEERPHPNSAVIIPAEWRDAHTSTRRSIAQRLGAAPTVTAAEADQIIAEEVNRRDQASAAFAEREEARARERGPRDATGQPANQEPIPDDWQSLSAKERRSLAAKLGAEEGLNAAEADAYITAEQKRRGVPDAGAERQPLNG
jgi:hypothetical protein